MSDLRKSENAIARKRIMVVDDHPMSREGIVQWIRNEPDLDVCCEARTAEEALDAVITVKPDLVLTDITLPGKSGLEFIKDIHAIVPALPVLVISMHDETLYAERVLRAGASGYVTKQEGGDTIILAIRRILSGQIHLSQRMQGQILQTFAARRHAVLRPGIEKLSDREFEIFQFIGQGLSTLEIAKRLHLSPKTVDAHRATIKSKLDLKTAAQLISYAATWTAHEVRGQ